MKTKTKALALFLSAVLLVVTTVFTTMAFLTSTDKVKNTFTFGQVGITLDEADVNENGVVEAGEDRTKTDGRVDENKYHLIPGHTYVKDPTVHVDANSEDCWLFVQLKNDLKDIIGVTTIEGQMEIHGWSLIDASKNIWAYKETVSADEDIPVFDSFKLVDNADVSKYATEDSGKTIELTAYAVQADGFNYASDAWAAADFAVN